MYGYVRPIKGELKVSQYEQFRHVYCGLCRELNHRGGFFARFVVNYDFTFLAMLLSDAGFVCNEKASCPARLGRKCPCITTGSAMSLAADESIILAWEKLNDGIADNKPLKSFKYRLAKCFLTLAYQRARLARPDFADTVSARLAALNRLEQEHCPRLDETADQFAQILFAAPDRDNPHYRIFSELLYHLGRIIYILDAIDDLEDDFRENRYNPLQYRFRLHSAQLADEQKEDLRQILCRSQQQMAAAFALLEKTEWQPILENIIYLGIPQAIESVLNGTWNTKDRRYHERPL